MQQLLPGQHEESGIFDRVINPTLGVLQQPIWRIWRALKEEDIDLLSRQGLLDPALLPILGTLFTQRNRVDPDELFGDNIGAQIAGSILTDPLTFLTGGLTAGAKLGKGLGALQGTGLLKALGKQAGVEGAETLAQKELMQSVVKHYGTNKGLREGLEELAKKGSGAALEAPDYKLMRKILKQGDGLADDLSLDAAFAGRGQRELGLGLPLIGDLFGQYVPLGEKLQKTYGGSWGSFYMRGIVGNTYKALGGGIVAPVHLVGKAGGRIPLLTPLFNRATELAQDFGANYAGGNKSALILERIRNLKDQTGFGPGGLGADDIERVLGKEGTDTANAFVSRASVLFAGTPEGAALARNNKGRLMESFNLLGQEEQAQYLTKVLDQLPGQRDLAEKVRGIINLDEGARVTPAELNKLRGKDPNTYKALVAQAGEKGKLSPKQASDFLKSSTLDQDLKSLLGLEDDVLLQAEHVDQFLNTRKNVTQAVEQARPEFLARPVEVRTAAGRLGKVLARWKTLIFKNDIGIEGFEEITAFKNHVVSESQRVLEGTGNAFYAKLEELSRSSNIEEPYLEKLFLGIQELSPTEQEFQKLTEGLRGTHGLEGQQAGFAELDAWFESRGATSLSYLLGTITENLKGSELDMFDDLFKLLGTSPDSPSFLAHFDGVAKLSKAYGYSQELGQTFVPSLLDRNAVTLDKTFDHLFNTLPFKQRNRAGKALNNFRKAGQAISKPIGAMTMVEAQGATVTLLDMIPQIPGVTAKEMSRARDLVNQGGSLQRLGILPKVREYFSRVDQEEVFRAGKSFSADADKVIAKEMFAALDAHMLNPKRGFDFGGEVEDLFTARDAKFMGRHTESGFVRATKEELDALPANALATEDEVDGFKAAFTNMVAAKKMIDMWRASNGGDSLMEMPMNLLQNLQDHMTEVSKLVARTALKPLGEGGEKVYDALSLVRSSMFETADAAGMLPDVVPLGFAHRIKDGETQRAIANALGGLAGSDGVTFSPYVNSLFRRSNRNYTIRELNLLRKQLADMSGPEAKKAHEVINTALHNDNLAVPAEHYRESAVDAMLGHMANVREFGDHMSYFTKVFGSKVAKENGLIAGRVKRVFENAGGAKMTKQSAGLSGTVALDPETGETLLNVATDALPRRNASIGYVLETLDGTETIISHEMVESGGFSLNALGEGKDLKSAMVNFLRTRNPQSFDGPLTLHEAKNLEGNFITMAPVSVNQAVFKEMENTRPSGLSGLLKTYDSLHTTLKLLATGLRFPLQFGTANTISAIPQGMLTGIGGHNMVHGMWLAARAFGGPMDDIVSLDEMSALLALKGGRVGRRPVPRIIDAAVGRRAGGELIRQVDRVAGGLAPAEDLMMEVGNRTFSFQEIVTAMVEAGAWEVRTSGELKNIRSTPEMLQNMRKVFMHPGLQGKVARGREAALGFASSTEQFVRLSGMLGALSGGMDLDTAARAVSDAMVDYSNLTKIEKEVAKRAIFFYTFPRKMIPLVFGKALNNPAKAAAFVHSTIGNKDLFESSEGRIEMKIDDYRVNAGRLAPQFDALVMLASMADILPIDVRRMTGEARPDLPFTPSGVASIVGWHDFFPTEDPLSVRGGDWVDDAIRSNWLSRFMVGDKLLGSNDPQVTHSPLELAAKSFLPYRKVRPNSEQERKIRRLSMTMRDVKADLRAATLAGDQDAINGAQRVLGRIHESMRAARSNQHKNVNY